MAVPPPRAALDPDEEARLVERVRRGDTRAFDGLVRHYLRPGYGVAFRILGHPEDAEDLVQEAFMVALERIDTFEAGRPFGPWFFRIVTNRALNRRKSRSLRRTEEIPDSTVAETAAPDRAAERAEVRDRVAAALQTLPERQRDVVRLFELEGFTSPEIAEMLGISDGTVRWHLHAARKALRDALMTREDA